jgi:hypothetical protein
MVRHRLQLVWSPQGNDPEPVTYTAQEEDAGSRSRGGQSTHGYRPRFTPRNLFERFSQRPIIHRPQYCPTTRIFGASVVPPGRPGRSLNRCLGRSVLRTLGLWSVVLQAREPTLRYQSTTQRWHPLSHFIAPFNRNREGCVRRASNGGFRPTSPL